MEEKEYEIQRGNKFISDFSLNLWFRIKTYLIPILLENIHWVQRIYSTDKSVGSDVIEPYKSKILDSKKLSLIIIYPLTEFI